MMFSHESAMRELKRLNDNGGAGLYSVQKRWYGWVIAENYYGNFDMTPQPDHVSLTIGKLEKIYDDAFTHKDIARTVHDIAKLIADLKSPQDAGQDPRSNDQ
jgi:hypothetical protein